MAMGMTYEQYWYGDPWMVVTYKRAHQLKVEMLNQQMWLQGLYIHNAVQAVVSTAMGKRAKYIEKPLDLKPKDNEKEKQKAILFFEQLRLRWEQKGVTDG